MNFTFRLICIRYGNSFEQNLKGNRMSLKIRKALPSDVAQIVRFVKDLALYEKEPDSAVLTEADILRDGFGENPYFFVLMAEWNDVPVGFAFYFFNYSTWRGRPGIFLEDLYVNPEYRGKGIGKSLLKEIAKIAVENRCERIQWQVLDWNKPSIDFYESLSAFNLKEWYTYRLEGNALKKLAE